MPHPAARATILPILVAILCVAATERASAQWFRGAGYVAAGAASTATGSLDDRLTAQAYPSFGSGAAAIGIGVYATIGRSLLLGGEWTGLIKDPQEHQGRTVYLGGGYGTLGAAYAFNVSPRIRIYPRIGLGAGGLGLTFESVEDTVAFDDVLSDPDGEAASTRGFQPTLTREHVAIDIGGGAEFLPSRNGRGTFIGVRAGYVIAPSTTEWRLNHRAVSDGPDATIAGLYIRLTVGAAAWR